MQIFLWTSFFSSRRGTFEKKRKSLKFRDYRRHFGPKAAPGGLRKSSRNAPGPRAEKHELPGVGRFSSATPRWKSAAPAVSVEHAKHGGNWGEKPGNIGQGGRGGIGRRKRAKSSNAGEELHWRGRSGRLDVLRSPSGGFNAGRGRNREGKGEEGRKSRRRGGNP